LIIITLAVQSYAGRADAGVERLAGIVDMLLVSPATLSENAV
jgi:hypothetical protein